MSLLSNRRVRLEVGAQALNGELAGGWLRRSVIARVSVPLAAPQEGAGEVGAALLTALERLFDELASAAPLKDAEVDVELADSLLHFDVAQGEFAGHSAQQLEAVARACMRELLGEGIDETELRWQLQADERHLWICAVPLSLIADLRAAAAERGMRLRSLQPAFAACWNLHRGAIRSGLGVFASVRDAYAVVAFSRNGIVEALSAARCEAAPGPSGASAPAGAALDAQVWQLITSLGIDTQAVTQFVALAEPALLSTLRPHWRGIDTVGQAA